MEAHPDSRHWKNKFKALVCRLSSSLSFGEEALDFCSVGISACPAVKISSSRQFGKSSHQSGSKQCSQAAAAAQARSQQSQEEVVGRRCFHMNHRHRRQHKYPPMTGFHKHKRNNGRRVAARAAGSHWSSAAAVGGAEPAASGRGTFLAWQDLLSDSFFNTFGGKKPKDDYYYLCIFQLKAAHAARHHFVAVHRNTSSGSTAFQLVCRADRHHQEPLRPRSGRCSGSSSSR